MHQEMKDERRIAGYYKYVSLDMFKCEKIKGKYFVCLHAHLIYGKGLSSIYSMKYLEQGRQLNCIRYTL